MKDLQELAHQASAEIVKKYHRQTSLKEALRQSAREQSKVSNATPSMQHRGIHSYVGAVMLGGRAQYPHILGHLGAALPSRSGDKSR
jgi:hypothetical protein